MKMIKIAILYCAVMINIYSMEREEPSIPATTQADQQPTGISEQQGPFYTLKLDDTSIITVPEAIIQQLNAINSIIEDLGAQTDIIIPIPNITSPILTAVATITNYFLEDQTANVVLYLASLSPQQIVDVLLAFDYLDPKDQKIIPFLLSSSKDILFNKFLQNSAFQNPHDPFSFLQRNETTYSLSNYIIRQLYQADLEPLILSKIIKENRKNMISLDMYPVLALSNDGRYIAMSAKDATGEIDHSILLIYDIQNDTMAIYRSEYSITVATFDPNDSKYLVVGMQNNQLSILQTSPDHFHTYNSFIQQNSNIIINNSNLLNKSHAVQPIMSIDNNTSIEVLQFDTQAIQLACASTSDVKIYTYKTGQLLYDNMNYSVNERPLSLFFSLDGDWIGINYMSNNSTLYNLKFDKHIRNDTSPQIFINNDIYVGIYQFVIDSVFKSSIDECQRIKLYSLKNENIIKTITFRKKNNNAAVAIYFNSQSNILAVLDNSNDISLWYMQTQLNNAIDCKLLFSQNILEFVDNSISENESYAHTKEISFQPVVFIKILGENYKIFYTTSDTVNICTLFNTKEVENIINKISLLQTLILNKDKQKTLSPAEEAIIAPLLNYMQKEILQTPSVMPSSTTPPKKSYFNFDFAKNIVSYLKEKFSAFNWKQQTGAAICVGAACAVGAYAAYKHLNK